MYVQRNYFWFSFSFSFLIFTVRHNGKGLAKAGHRKHYTSHKH